MLFALMLACAPFARAGQDVHGDTFVSGTSLENLALGTLDPKLADDGTVSTGLFHWQAEDDLEIGNVKAYEAGDAYDYEAHGLERNEYLATEEPGTSKYLSLCAEGALDRSIFARSDPTESFSNVIVRTASRDSIYCDLLTRFTVSESAPEYDASSARLVVWARLLETEDGDLYTNLIVTAGCYTNGFRQVLARNYVLDFPLDLSQWYRLTIRAHGDVSAQEVGLSCFSIYIDGEPVRAESDGYSICEGTLRSSLFTSEARALHGDRRLFPSLAPPSSDMAFTISGFTFVGDGEVDDISFSSSDPGYGKPEAVFTLNWDNGVSALKYTLDGGLTTNEVDTTSARTREILIGNAPTNGLTLKVFDVAYKTDFHPGVWRATNGAFLTNETTTAGEFVYDGTTRNPNATVASTREVVVIGEGGFDTFAAAIDYLDNDPRFTNATKTIVLNQDYTIIRSSDDGGSLTMTNPEGDYVLDLNGHTLKGSGRTATVQVSCRSFRIIDSSEENPVTHLKSGCVKPVQDYTNALASMNTAINVYPRSNRGVIVRPVLTIEDGIIDGWVRNDGWRSRTDEPLTGEVYVEGGSYISTNGATFYLDSSVTNASLQFIYRDGYWAKCATTNAVIWTGLGDGRSWTDPENWKSHQLPTATETALFPSRAAGADPWTVDVGANAMTTKSLWLEGDIRLSGSNDFVGVTLTGGGSGRITGDATLAFVGSMPGRLSETILRDDFGGTVWLKNVGYGGSPVIMSYLETWGTTNSTVVFNGVYGYVRDMRTHTMEYDLVLMDDVLESGGVLTTNLAWKNNSGYTGSTLEFNGMLSGNGTFSSGANAKAIRQLIKFADVLDYRGKFIVNGKRVLVGNGTVSSSQVGLIAFGDAAVVAAGLGWTCQYATFEGSLGILGETNDVLVTCVTATAWTSGPDVTVCTNVVLVTHPEQTIKLGRKHSSTYKTWQVYVKWDPSAAVTASSVSPTVAAAPVLSMAAANSMISSTASYSAAANRATVVANELIAAALVSNAVQVLDASIEIGIDTIGITINNATPGLYYGVEYCPSLGGEWESPQLWYLAESSTVEIDCDRQSDSGFYRVMVSSADQLGADSADGGGGGQ